MHRVRSPSTVRSRWRSSSRASAGDTRSLWPRAAVVSLLSTRTYGRVRRRERSLPRPRPVPPPSCSLPTDDIYAEDSLTRHVRWSLPFFAFFVLIDQVDVEVLDGHFRFVHSLLDESGTHGRGGCHLKTEHEHMDTLPFAESRRCHFLSMNEQWKKRTQRREE